MTTLSRFVLVTRPARQASELCNQLHAAGFEPIRFPTINIVPTYTSEELAHQLNSVAGCRKAIFTSQNAVFVTAAFIRQHWNFEQTHVYAVGSETARALQSFDIPVTKVALPHAGSESLLEISVFHDIAQKPVALITGRQGRTYLHEELLRRHAFVHRVDVYARECPVNPDPMIWQQWQAQGLNVIMAGSQETLMNLLKMIDVSGHEFLRRCILVTLSQRIATDARQLGFSGPICIAETASNMGIVQCLRNFNERMKQ